MSRRSSEWMFCEWPRDSFMHASQVLSLAVLRLFVVGFYLPIARPLSRWLTRWLVRS